jgi:dihydrofolate reductase
MQIKMILATDSNGCIGYNNDLVFKSRKDLKRFKELTTNNIVVMGSKTYESLGSKPLPNRINIVLSNKLNDNNVHVYNNINTMLSEMIQYYPDKTIWIIGGANIYNQFINIVDEVYLTLFFETSDKCNTFVDIKSFLDNDFIISDYEEHEENGLNFSFINYKRNGR